MFSRKRACGTGSGFTLIELLVVISVIAMLLAILMPSLGMIKEKGKSLVDRNQIRQLALAGKRRQHQTCFQFAVGTADNCKH